MPFYDIKISKMNWYKEYPAGIESWKFLFPQSVYKMLLFNEKIINISLTKQKKKLADLWSKSLAKFWCFNVDNKILLFISGCGHIWCESQFFWPRTASLIQLMKPSQYCNTLHLVFCYQPASKFLTWTRIASCSCYVMVHIGSDVILL